MKTNEGPAFPTDQDPNEVSYTHYGFLIHGELLHMQVTWHDSKGTYELISREIGYPSTGAKVTRPPTLGEWVTTDIRLILHMYLDPGNFINSGIHDPLPTYGTKQGNAVPVAIHTWRRGNAMQKSYVPLLIPIPLPSMDVISYTINLLHGAERRMYTYHGKEALSVGGKYYTDGYGELTIYDCVAKISKDQYLLLVLTDEELLTHIT